VFSIIDGPAWEPSRPERIWITMEDSLRGRVKPDAKEIGDCAPKAVQISHGPIVESTVIVEVQAAFVV